MAQTFWITVRVRIRQVMVMVTVRVSLQKINVSMFCAQKTWTHHSVYIVCS